MTSTSAPSHWICCHLGAREHYAVPRALQRLGKLRFMIADAWTRPGSPLGVLPGQLPRRLAERFHPELETADVRDFTMSMLKQEVEWRLQRRSGWDLVMARNEWFQSAAVEQLLPFRERPGDRVVVFAYSYSARAIFELAKQRGWTTVLGQIDPGEEHFSIVRRLADRSPEYGTAPQAPPIEYFERWREECRLADHILVNSEWSREALVRAGIDRARLNVVPLVYERASVSATTRRRYPDRFTHERPLRVLFVGHVSVAKGAPQLIEAMKLLSGLPVHLKLVGELGMDVPAGLRALPEIEWVGSVPRSDLAKHYGAADVLVFPSHSDGFGIVQIEAQGYGVPVIASAFCGSVVRDGVNGLLLPEVSATAIATAIRAVVSQPALLEQFSANAVAGGEAGLDSLGSALVRMVATPRTA